MAAAPVNEMMSVMLAPLMDQLTQGRITAAQYSDLSRSIISQAQPPKNKPLSNVTAPREPAIDKDSAQQREAAPTTSPGGSNLPPSDADLDTSQESICNSQESICTSPEDDASIGLAMDDIQDVDAEESPLKRARANDQPAGQHASEGPAHQPAKPTDAAQIESELKEQREMVFGGFKPKLPVARDKKTRKRPLNKPPAARGRGPSHKKNGSRGPLMFRMQLCVTGRVNTLVKGLRCGRASCTVVNVATILGPASLLVTHTSRPTHTRRPKLLEPWKMKRSRN